MAIAGLDNEQYDDDGQQDDGFEPIPAGTYAAEIQQAKEVQKDWGSGIKVQWRITGPSYANRRVFGTMCVNHDKETPAQIARGNLKNLGRWNGLEGRYPDTPEQMQGWTAHIEVGYWTGDDGRVSESVNGFQKPDGQASGPADPQPPEYETACAQAEGGGGSSSSESDNDAAPDMDDDIPF